jgi:hypothetical protein
VYSTVKCKLTFPHPFIIAEILSAHMVCMPLALSKRELELSLCLSNNVDIEWGIKIKSIISYKGTSNVVQTGYRHPLSLILL